MIKVKKVLLIVTLLCLVSCQTSKQSHQEYEVVTVSQLMEKPSEYNQRYVKLNGYILGSEYQKTKNDVSSYIVVISNKPKVGGDGNSIFHPDVLKKIRGAEFGYNDAVLKKCDNYSKDAVARNQAVTLYGQFFEKTSFRQYGEGVQLRLTKVNFGFRTLNCNYGDTNTFTKKAPGVMKLMYKGAKKLGELLGKSF